MSTMKPGDLKIYAETGSIKRITLVANGCTWTVKIQVGPKDSRWLTTVKSNQPRVFVSFTKMMSFLQKAGCNLSKLITDGKHYDPDAPKERKRQDVSESLKAIHEQAKKAKKGERLCDRCGESLSKDEPHDHDCDETNAPDTPPLLTHDHDPDPD